MPFILLRKAAFTGWIPCLTHRMNCPLVTASTGAIAAGGCDISLQDPRAGACVREGRSSLNFLRSGRARFEVLGEPGVEIGNVINDAPADLGKARTLAAAPELVQG